MIKKAAQVIAVALLILLAVFPLLFRALMAIPGFFLPSVDLVQVNLVFMFAAIAGIITTADNKQLSLSALSDNLPDPVLRIIEPMRTGLSICILTALFFNSVSATFLVFTPDEKLWGIPMTLIFFSLPLMFLGIIFLTLRRPEKLIASVVGLVTGIMIAAGPIAGILWSLFQIEQVPVLNAVFDGWIATSGLFLWPLIGILVLGAVFGVPLFIVLSGLAYVTFSQGGGYVELISLETYNILTDKSIAAIPLFTLGGFLLAQGSAGKRLLEIIKHSVGWVRGGPVVATVIVATFFTTFTGASGVTILALGGLLSVILTGSGYSKSNAESLITSSGSLGLLFPPSLAVIIYGTTNIFSVDVYDLFKGAIIPGILMATGMIVMGILKDTSHSRTNFSIKELLISLKNSLPELVLPVCIVLGYFSGFFSLIETAAFTAIYAFILEVFVRRDFTIIDGFRISLKSIPIAGGILVIIGAAKGLSSFLIDAGIPMQLTALVEYYVQSRYLFLFLLNVLLLLVGCLMDLYSAILVVSPLIIPVAESFGIHPVHTGVIFLTNLALGFLTPPVGMNLFIASYTFEKPIMRIVRNIIPYLLLQFVILMLVTYVPFFTMALL